MKENLKKYGPVAVVGASVASVALAPLAGAQTTAVDAVSGLGDGIGTGLTTVLTDNLPTVGGIMAAMIGLGLLVKLFRKT